MQFISLVFSLFLWFFIAVFPTNGFKINVPYSSIHHNSRSCLSRRGDLRLNLDLVSIHEHNIKNPNPIISNKYQSDSHNNLIQHHNKHNTMGKGIVCSKLIPILLPLLVIIASPAASMASSALPTGLVVGDSGLLQSFLLIFVSEIGDKTFFIAALLAAKYGKTISFTGSMLALALMTGISTAIGQIFHAIPSSITQGVPFDDYIAVVAFAYFGVKTLVEASKADSQSSSIEEEKAEAEELVADATAAQKRNSFISAILQTFSLVFAAEIGDRSFLSTIALSATLNPLAIASGAVAAHAVATGIAVIGGTLLSKYLSEKVIGYIGGTLFIIFAITTALGLF